MDNMNDLVNALKYCQRECGGVEDNISDVDSSARDAAEASENALCKVQDVVATIDDALALAGSLANKESGICPIEVEDLLITMRIMIDGCAAQLSRGRARLFTQAEDWDIELKEE